MTIRIAKRVLSLGSDERGVTTVEYTIVLCLIAAVAVASWKTFGSNVKGYIDTATNNINTAMQK